MSYDFFASFYDELTGDVRYDEYALYVDRIIKEYCPDAKIVLDAACGTGSMTVRLAKLGYDMIGVDQSIGMLDVAKNKSDDRVLYLCQDLTQLDLYGTIDACVCALDSFNHIESEGKLLEAFKKISLFTVEGGIFIFDLNTLYKHREILSDNTFVYDLDDVYCVWQNFYNPDDSSVDIELDFFEKQGDVYRRYFESFSEFYYDDETVKDLLEQSGFELVGHFDNLSFEKPTGDSERTVFIARKTNG
ncbi:MAG: methyltransferase domain-containing protein [Clostridia bacterium]|nr:methyltransferase domain-containing protein [Clostridia bacterium]